MASSAKVTEARANLVRLLMQPAASPPADATVVAPPAPPPELTKAELAPVDQGKPVEPQQDEPQQDEPQQDEPQPGDTPAPPAPPGPPPPPPPGSDPSTTAPPVLTDAQREAAAALTAAKQAANLQWLKKLGKYLWIATLIASAIALVATFDQNRRPTSARHLTDQIAKASRAADDARSALAGGTGKLGADVVAVLKADAADIRASAAAMRKAADALPNSWSGQALAQPRQTARSAASALGTQAVRLQGAATTGAAKATLDRLDKTLARLRTVKVNPAWVWPWQFTDQPAQGFVYAIVLTLALLGALSLLLRADGGLRTFLVGGDGRFSTGQTQAAIWTVAIFFLLAHLLLRSVPGRFDHLDDTYLLLLGGPYAAWVVGGAITRSKLSSADIQKVVSPEAQVRDLVCDDNGRASLTDAQFFLFSMLALVGVFVTFAQHPAALPAIPSGLALLTSAGALVYTGKKAVDKDAPQIFSVSPDGSGVIVPGSVIRIRGENFLPPGSSGDVDVLATAVTVRFKSGGVSFDEQIAPSLTTQISTPQQASSAASNLSSEELRVTVPRLPAGPATVSVITASGASTAEKDFDVAAAVLITSAEMVGNKIRLVGQGFAPAHQRSYTTLKVGASTAVPFHWITDEHIEAAVPPNTTGSTEITLTGLTGSATAHLTV